MAIMDLQAGIDAINRDIRMLFNSQQSNVLGATVDEEINIERVVNDLKITEKRRHIAAGVVASNALTIKSADLSFNLTPTAFQWRRLNPDLTVLQDDPNPNAATYLTGQVIGKIICAAFGVPVNERQDSNYQGSFPDDSAFPPSPNNGEFAHSQATDTVWEYIGTGSTPGWYDTGQPLGGTAYPNKEWDIAKWFSVLKAQCSVGMLVNTSANNADLYSARTESTVQPDTPSVPTSEIDGIPSYQEVLAWFNTNTVSTTKDTLVLGKVDGNPSKVTVYRTRTAALGGGIETIWPTLSPTWAAYSSFDVDIVKPGTRFVVGRIPTTPQPPTSPWTQSMYIYKDMSVGVWKIGATHSYTPPTVYEDHNYYSDTDLPFGWYIGSNGRPNQVLKVPHNEAAIQDLDNNSIIDDWKVTYQYLSFVANTACIAGMIYQDSTKLAPYDMYECLLAGTYNTINTNNTGRVLTVSVIGGTGGGGGGGTGNEITNLEFVPVNGELKAHVTYASGITDNIDIPEVNAAVSNGLMPKDLAVQIQTIQGDIYTLRGMGQTASYFGFPVSFGVKDYPADVDVDDVQNYPVPVQNKTSALSEYWLSQGHDVVNGGAIVVNLDQGTEEQTTHVRAGHGWIFTQSSGNAPGFAGPALVPIGSGTATQPDGEPFYTFTLEGLPVVNPQDEFRTYLDNVRNLMGEMPFREAHTGDYAFCAWVDSTTGQRTGVTRPDGSVSLGRWVIYAGGDPLKDTSYHIHDDQPHVDVSGASHTYALWDDDTKHMPQTGIWHDRGENLVRISSNAWTGIVKGVQDQGAGAEDGKITVDAGTGEMSVIGWSDLTQLVNNAVSLSQSILVTMIGNQNNTAFDADAPAGQNNVSYTLQDFMQKVAQRINYLFAEKVDKQSGYQLTEHNFSNQDYADLQALKDFQRVTKIWHDDTVVSYNSDAPFRRDDVTVSRYMVKGDIGPSRTGGIGSGFNTVESATMTNTVINSYQHYLEIVIQGLKLRCIKIGNVAYNDPGQGQYDRFGTALSVEQNSSPLRAVIKRGSFANSSFEGNSYPSASVLNADQQQNGFPFEYGTWYNIDVNGWFCGSGLEYHIYQIYFPNIVHNAGQPNETKGEWWECVIFSPNRGSDLMISAERRF